MERVRLAGGVLGGEMTDITMKERSTTVDAFHSLTQGLEIDKYIVIK